MADGSAIRLGTDPLGFRHVYYAEGEGWAAASTSAAALAIAAHADLDPESVAALSLLGWQIGLTTPFVGVRKVPAGARLTLTDGRALLEPPEPHSPNRMADLNSAVELAANRLSTSMERLLDDYPDAVMQLSGGLDSRILLAAVPPGRRPGLRAMTLEVPASEDGIIARRLSGRWNLDHHIKEISGIESLDPTQANNLVSAAGERLAYSADPLHFASLAVAEGYSREIRVSGLGGEVVRGFYYSGLGPSVKLHVTPGRVKRLAEWRLFPNGSVPRSTLTEDFADYASKRTIERLTEYLSSYGPEWREATDQFYLRQRMHRWAGVTETANCLERIVINPMLDREFLDLGLSLPTEWRASAQYLSRILHRLDPELAALPMDGRPPPNVFAFPTARNRARLVTSAAQKASQKGLQRSLSRRKPPPGGSTLAGLTTSFWRQNPETLGRVRRLGVLKAQWIDHVLDGLIEPAPAEVALLANLIGASNTTSAWDEPASVTSGSNC